MVAVEGTILSSITCRCPRPEFVNPASSDVVISPYLPTGGCIKPRFLQALRVVSDEVSIALVKPHNSRRLINATLVMEGDDTEHLANWSVVNSHLVRARSPWLQLPSSGGEVAGAARLDIAVVLSAAGLRERTTPYSDTLEVNVRSALEISERLVQLDVSILVTAATHTSVWGTPSGGAACSSALPPSLDVDTTVGDERRVAFTACDVDHLPVAHQLPSLSDPRTFKASLEAYGATSSVAIKYSGDGTYDVLLTLQTHGRFTLSLRLEAAVIALSGRATCPTGREPLPGGFCGCSDGTFESTGTGTCEPCQTGTSSVAGGVGASACSICGSGYYRSAEGEPCSPCIEGATCPTNSTL